MLLAHLNWSSFFEGRSMLLTWVLLLIANTAHAVDGVVEINQTCAENSGCTSSDAAGFPVTITEPGSYRLTGNLMLTGADDKAIEISAAHVTVDLNGFSIIGPAVCTGEPVSSCENQGTGAGISALNNPLYHHITILNGDIRGAGGSAISMSGVLAVHVENVRAVSNGDYGFRVGLQAVINGCVAESNGSIGIGASTRARILNSTAVFNNGIGINAASYSLIQDSAAITNDSIGVGCVESCVIDTVVSRGNGMSGISASHATVVQNSTVTDNMGAGITCGTGCLVRSNVSSGNSGSQILISGESAYVGNVLTGEGAVIGAGAVEIGLNLCNGNTMCP